MKNIYKDLYIKYNKIYIKTNNFYKIKKNYIFKLLSIIIFLYNKNNNFIIYISLNDNII